MPLPHVIMTTMVLPCYEGCLAMGNLPRERMECLDSWGVVEDFP